MVMVMGDGRRRRRWRKGEDGKEEKGGEMSGREENPRRLVAERGKNCYIIARI